MIQQITNVNVYGLANSVRVSKFPMAADKDKCVAEVTNMTNTLATAPRGSGHDNFLKGIIVQFDLTASIKMWTEAERYHWFDIVSSQSTMHRVMKLTEYDEHVTDATKAEVQRLKDIYDKCSTPENYLTLLYNMPTGTMLTAGITTNYQQLKTIYAQRKDHRLTEWRRFCKWIKSLPHSEWITL